MDDEVWPKVFIIILNWNGGEDTIECLESLDKISYPNYHVVVVDNGSQDDSLAKISAYARVASEADSTPLQTHRREPSIISTYTRREVEEVKPEDLIETLATARSGNAPNASLSIIRNERNFGYAEGNNIGIRYALKAAADYVLLLNNDTVVDKCFLTELVRAADKDTSIGATGPKIYWYYKPGVIESTGARMDLRKGTPTSINRGKTDDELVHADALVSADYIPGACILIKRSVVEEVGLLDPIYFLYFEDVDWCTRISRAGYKIVCNLNSKIWHKTGASTSKVKRFYQHDHERSRMIYMRKFARKPQFIFFLILHTLRDITFLIKTFQFDFFRHYVRGSIDGLLAPTTAHPTTFGYDSSHRHAETLADYNNDTINTNFDFGWKAWRKRRPDAYLAFQYQRGNILEVGCGTCELCRFLRAHGWNGDYYGIDLQKYEAYEYPKDAKLIIGDALDVDFPPADTVVLYSILEHVDDPRRLIRKALESCSQNVLINAPKRNEEMWEYGILEYHQLDKTHKHYGFSPEELKTLISRSGGTITAFEEWGKVDATVAAGLWNNIVPKATIWLLSRIFSSKKFYGEMWCNVEPTMRKADSPNSSDTSPL